MKTNQNNNRIGSIESSILTIQNILSSNLAAGLTVVRKRAVRGSSCKGVLNIVTAGAEEGWKEKKPLVTYAFYAGTYFPTRLGSVAIYAGNPTALLAQIKGSKTLFGIPVVDAKIEYGVKPFLDVSFAA